MLCCLFCALLTAASARDFIKPFFWAVMTLTFRFETKLLLIIAWVFAGGFWFTDNGLSAFLKLLERSILRRLWFVFLSMFSRSEHDLVLRLASLCCPSGCVFFFSVLTTVFTASASLISFARLIVGQNYDINVAHISSRSGMVDAHKSSLHMCNILVQLYARDENEAHAENTEE